MPLKVCTSVDTIMSEFGLILVLEIVFSNDLPYRPPENWAEDDDFVKGFSIPKKVGKSGRKYIMESKRAYLEEKDAMKVGLLRQTLINTTINDCLNRYDNFGKNAPQKKSVVRFH